MIPTVPPPTVEQVALATARRQIERAQDSLALDYLTAAALELEDAVANIRDAITRRARGVVR